MRNQFYITLVRHGETIENRENIIQGQADTQLSDLGRQQASLVAGRLQNEHFTHMYASDLARAADTAKAIAATNEKSNCPLTFDKRLRERSFGVLEGKKFNEFQALVKELNVTPQTYTPQNGEKVEQVSQRAMHFFKDVCEMIATSSENLCSSDTHQSCLEDVNVSSTENLDDQGAGSNPVVTSCDNSLSNSNGIKEPLIVDLENSADESTSNGSREPHESPNPELVEKHILIVSHGLLLRELQRLILDRYKGALIGENARQAHRISPNTGVSKFRLGTNMIGKKIKVVCTDCYFINCSDHLRLSNENLVSEAKYQGTV